MRLAGELLKRYPGNPILTWKDLPYHVNAVYNPGAVKHGDEYILVPRVEDGRRDNRLHIARSRDGIHFTVEPEPIALPGSPEDLAWEKHQYDARVTPLDGAYYIAYCAQTMGEVVRIGLARTEDFRAFERLPFATQPWNRNCALFPEKIGGLYARLDRPMSGSDAITFVTFSPDLVYWGRSRPLELQVQTWMREKWGIGPPPIRTDEGWLLIIHGVWLACNYVYRLGVVLLDLEDPCRVIGQCPDFILTPREDYERCGEVPNCVFANGAILEPDGELKVYYGAADTCIGLATGHVDELIAACKSGIRPGRS
ncbi:MAG: glycosylase [Armatimonadota bacterium]|nr:MAG: glycosylase [Armatimonadota bacterium]